MLQIKLMQSSQKPAPHPLLNKWMDNMSELTTQVVTFLWISLPWRPRESDLWLPGYVAMKAHILVQLTVFGAYSSTDPSLGRQSQSYCVCPDEPHTGTY